MFNDSRDEIRKKINDSFISGVKGDEDELADYYDYFEDSELFVYYDKNNKINAFEFFKPKPVFNNINLLAKSFKELIDFFSKIDSDLITSSTEFTSYKYGIGANVSNESGDDADPPEAIIIFKKGYYNLLEAYIKNFNKDN